MNLFISSLVGLGAGILASMGMGGGFILVVYLAICTDIAQKTTQGINLLFFIPVIIVAVIIHIRNKLIDLKTALICSAIGVPAVVIGFYVTQAISNGFLRSCFAVFVIIAGAKDLFSRKQKEEK